MQRVEHLLLAQELKSLVGEEGVDSCRLLVALTCPGCREGVDYEREELLGDSYLKYAVARGLAITAIRGEVDTARLTEMRQVTNSGPLFPQRQSHTVSTAD